MTNFRSVYVVVQDHIADHMSNVIEYLHSTQQTSFIQLPIAEIMTRLFVSVISLIASLYEVVRYLVNYPVFKLFMPVNK